MKGLLIKSCFGEKKRKKTLLVFIAAIFILSMSPIFAKDTVESSVKENLKKIKEETKLFAKEQNREAKTILESLFSEGKLSTYSEDFLPEEDQGKSFDHELAAEKTDKQELSPFEASLQEVIDSSEPRCQHESRGQHNDVHQKHQERHDPDAQGLEVLPPKRVDAQKFETA